MDMVRKVRRLYQQYVMTQVPESDLRRALKYQERVPLLIDNLATELHKVSMSRARAFSDHELQSMVWDFCAMFVHGVRAASDAKHMSDLEKSRRLAEIQKAEAFKQLSDSLMGEENVTVDSKGNETSRTAVKVQDRIL